MKKQLLSLILLSSVSLSVVPVHTYAYTQEIQRAKVLQSVNFREQPTTSGDRIRYLKTGEVLDVLNEYNSNWLQVKDSRGVVGYVSSSSQYIKQESVKVTPESNGVIVSGVNLRSSSSSDSRVIRMMQKGEPVWVLEQVNKYWYKVGDKYDNIGYVSTNAKYINTTFKQEEMQPDEVIEAEEEPLFKSPPNAKIISSVSFRTKPDADATRIRYLKAGEQLLVLDKTNKYWYNVQDENGQIGYVSTSSQYISTTYVEPYKLLDPSVAAQKVIDAGMKYVGTPYEFGSSRYDTTTFDCSDFVRQAFLEGIDHMLPGDSRSQGAYVQGIGKTSTDWQQLKRGDLLFFMSYLGSSASNYAGVDKTKQTITHVGIYLGDGKMLHTYSSASGGVRIDDIKGTQWENRFLFGGSTN